MHEGFCPPGFRIPEPVLSRGLSTAWTRLGVSVRARVCVCVRVHPVVVLHQEPLDSGLSPPNSTSIPPNLALFSLGLH